jgi:hypothetical protein
MVHATVLQLPAAVRPEVREKQTTPELREPFAFLLTRMPASGAHLCDFDARADDAIVGGIMKVTAVTEDAPRV